MAASSGQTETIKQPDLTGSDVGKVIWGSSASMKALRRLITDTAETDLPIFLVGESGSGKEAMAWEVHRLSRHRDSAFFKFNCRSLNHGGLLAQLQASSSENGSGFSAPTRGTMLLDNVCELDHEGQQRLLIHLPEERVVSSGNGNATRLVSTARREIEDDFRAGIFNAELYFRLNGVCLRVPSLRQRKEDVPELVDHFLDMYGDLFERSRPKISEECMRRLSEYSWPGNVRQLETTIKRIVATGDPEIAMADLVEISRGVPRETQSLNQSLKVASRAASRQAERELLSKALERTHWNRKRAAQELQISYKALLYKLKQLGLDNTEIS
jgi:two-component system, NtrC family, response regulator AtoC